MRFLRGAAAFAAKHKRTMEIVQMVDVRLSSPLSSSVRVFNALHR